MIVGGYVYVYLPAHPNSTAAGYVAEHRIAMEKIAGRLIAKTEAVHHIDGNTTNNDPKNLQLCSSNGKHSAEHRVVRNAVGKFGKNSSTKPANQKLTTAQTLEAISRRSAGEKYRTIADSYGVTISCINSVVRKHRGY